MRGEIGLNQKDGEYVYNLEVQKELFYSEETLWGVYSFRFVDPVSEMNSGIKLHDRFNTFTISGEIFKLSEGEKYNIRFKDHYTEKYGDGYQFVEVESEGLKRRSAQVEFLSEILPEKIVENISEQYSYSDTLLTDIVSEKIDLSTVKGIQQKQIPVYLERIKEYEKYQEAIVFLSPLGASVKAIVKLTDHFGGVRRLIEIIDKNIYKLTEVSNFGFRRVDDYALELGYKKSSPHRIKSGAYYVLEGMSNRGDIKIPIEDFDKEICKVLDIDAVTDDIFENIISSPDFYYENGYISLTFLREEEWQIAEKIHSLQSNAEPLEGFNEALEETIAEEEEKGGFTLTSEQRKAVALLGDNGVGIINGVAGSGKSFVTKIVVETLNKLNRSYAACSLSGKASNVLLEKGLVNSSTIHRLLKWRPDGDFVYNKENQMGYDLIILDEAPMVNNTLLNQLISAIRDGSRLLLVGDSGQLPPIGHGAVFENLLKVNVPRVELTQVHRQAAKSGIITTANQVRNHQQINSYGFSDTQVIGELQDMRVFNYLDKTSIYDDLMATIRRYHENPITDDKDLQVITAMKRGVLGVPSINQGVQNILNPNDNGKKPFIKVRGNEYRLGDRVIQNGNFYKALGFENILEYENFKKGKKKTLLDVTEDDNLFQEECGKETAIFNGSIGYIKDVVIDPKDKDSGILVEFDSYFGKEYIFYHHNEDKSEVGRLDLAYAITVHRSQGSGFGTVLFTFDYSAFMLLSKEFVYTGITRSINNCLMFVENSALHYAIKQTHSGNRKTYIREFADKLLN